MNIKYIKKGIVIAASFVAALTAQITFAAYDTNMTFSTCSLGIYPYNPSGTTVGMYDSQWFNLFPPGATSTCNSHLTYPNQYSPQPPLVSASPLKNVAGVENIRAPEARHNHIYHNASLEDNYYYKQWIDRYQIILEADALNNTDKYNIVCYTLTQSGGDAATPGCNGTLSDWGGTQISYDANSGIITWKFANSGSGRPMLWGNNPTIGTQPGMFYGAVKLISKNNPQEIWSGTTTSRVLLRTQAILKAGGQTAASLSSIGACTGDATAGSSYNYNGSWCTLPVPNHSGVEGSVSDTGTGGKTYYWYRIGVVGTIWRKPAPPPATCQSIVLTPNSVTAPGTTNYSARVTFDNGQSYNTTVSWGQTNGSLTRTSQTQSSASAFTNAYTTTATSGSVTARVTAITGANNSTACQNGVTVIKTPPATCTGITLTPNSVTAPGTTNYSARVTFDNGQSYNTTVTWGQTNGSLTRTSQTQSSASAFTNAYTTSQNSGSVTARVTAITGANNSTVCQNGVTVTKTPPATCTGITLTPNSVTAPGTTNYSARVTFSNGNSYPTTVSWGQTNGSLTRTSQTQSSASPFTSTYTTSQNSGSVTARVSAITGASNSSVCQNGVTVTKTPSAVCTGITLTPNTVAAPGTTAYTARVTFDDGNSYPATVNWGQQNGSFSSPTIQSHSTASPYTNTFTTAGTSGMVSAQVISVTGASNSAVCQSGVTVTTTPSATCTGITLRPNTITAPGSNNYTARVTFSDGKSYNAQLQWTQTNGTLSGGAPIQSQSSADPYRITYSTTNDTGSLRARVTNVVGASNSAVCQSGVSITTPPEEAVCEDVTLRSSAPTPLNEDQDTRLYASGINTDDTAVTTMLWTATAGTLTGYSTTHPELCARSGRDITLPSICQVYFSGGPEGTVISVSSVPPVAGNICRETITVVKREERPYCQYLTLSPNTLNYTGETDLRARAIFAIFSDGNTYRTTVRWNGSNGTYSGNTTQTLNSSQTFTNTFDVTDEREIAYASVRVTDIPGGEADIGDCQAAIRSYPPPPPECEELDLTCSDGTCCVDILPRDYDGTIEWTIGGRTTTEDLDNENCVYNVPDNTAVKAFVSEICQDETTTQPPEPPELSKSVRVVRTGPYRDVLTVPMQSETLQSILQYQIVFVPNGSNSVSAFITDDISDGRIIGETRPAPGPGGSIHYTTGSMTVTQEDRREIPQCTEERTENCWTGDIGNGGVNLVKVTGKVYITYEGTIWGSQIRQDICQEGEICQEKYTNVARASGIMFYDEEYNEIPPSEWGFPTSITSNEVLVQIFCQYILTRASGDIYMETDLNAGVDIRLCSKYTSTTGLIIVPGGPEDTELVSTGTATQIQSINHEICTQGQSGSIDPALKEFYGQTVSENLSSQICEVKLQAGSAWKQSAITNDIMENKTRISRWEPDYDTPITMSVIKMDESTYSQKQVYHIKDANLTVDSEYKLADGEGAKTFIIENGNLIIKGDIKYDNCKKDVCNVNDVASLAFIVLNGNVSISPDVTEISGVYFVQGECATSDAECDNGRLFSLDGADSTKQLTVYGSIYGDIGPLFEQRLYSGDPSLQQSGILIRFDERVILNTPPGLRDVLSLTQSEVAR